MPFCVKCGSQMAGGAAFCTKCGTGVSASAAPVAAQRAVVVVANQKSTGVAALLSFFWCGLGQIYNGQIFKGIVMMLIYPSLLGFGILSTFTGGLLAGGATTEAQAAAGGGAALLGVLALGGAVAFWVFGVINAYRTADRLNHEQQAAMLTRLE